MTDLWADTGHFVTRGKIVSLYTHKRNLANNIVGGGGAKEGGQNSPWVLGTLTNESNLKEAKTGPIKRKFFIFFFLSVSYLLLFNSVTRKSIHRLK
jgi:hypothetical protein